MSIIENIVILESLLKQVRELSEKEGISLDQFVCSAIAEKAAVWTTIEYLNERAKRGSREKFLQALSKVLRVEPDEEDTI